MSDDSSTRETAGLADCCSGGNRASGLAGQFGCPRGIVGRLVGWYMARRGRDGYQLAVDRLAPEPNDQVLEIGFGPGVGIELLAKRASEGAVYGVDLSELMVQKALQRNRRAAQDGRVTLQRASVDKLPFEAGRFDRALAAHTVHHWPNLERGFAEVARVLRPRGRFVVCLRREPQRPSRFGPPGLSKAQIAEIVRSLTAAGFTIEDDRPADETQNSAVIAAHK